MLSIIISIVNIVATSALGIAMYLNSRKSTKREEVYNALNILNMMFRVEQELKLIFKNFYEVLVSTTGKKELSNFDLSDDWRDRLSSIASHIPSEVISEIYSIYTFCEKVNSGHAKKYDMIDFLELNFIEYVSLNSSFYLANREISFYFKYVKHFKKDDKSILNNETKYIVTDNFNVKYDQNSILEYEKIDEINGFSVSSVFSQTGLESQKVYLKDDLVRDIALSGESYSGYDKFEINKKAFYYNYYRGNANKKLNSLFYASFSKPNIYEGELVNNQFNGKGIIKSKEKIITEGIFKNGRIFEGKEYNVEILKKYNNPKRQQRYEYEQQMNSEDYITFSMEAEENYYKQEFGYKSYRKDYKYKDGVKEEIKGSERIMEIEEYDEFI